MTYPQTPLKSLIYDIIRLYRQQSDRAQILGSMDRSKNQEFQFTGYRVIKFEMQDVIPSMKYMYTSASGEDGWTPVNHRRKKNRSQLADSEGMHSLRFAREVTLSDARWDCWFEN